MASTHQITQIDKAINANRAMLVLHDGFDRLCPGCWQSAWDRNPDLWEREQDLFRQRGRAQQVRNAEAEKAHRAEKRRSRRELSAA